MKFYLFLLILFLLIGCEHRVTSQINGEIVVDPWQPYSSNENGANASRPKDWVPPNRSDNQPVPEPSTLLLVGGGMVVICFTKRNKKNESY